MTQLKFLAIIPARFASTRFPGKPLAMLGGKPIIERVYERVSAIFPHVAVATDDERIMQAVASFGGKAVMTSASHRSGTDRCHEALLKMSQATGESYDVVVNVQGDEPFVSPSQLESIKACFDDADTQIATLVKPFDADAPKSLLWNPNSPKVVTDSRGMALYFSRSVIPYLRGKAEEEWLRCHRYLKHIGLYAYRTDTLAAITRLPQSPLELAESLEQLRWLEAGYNIKTALTDEETIGIDTPEDLERAEQFLLQNRNTAE